MKELFIYNTIQRKKVLFEPLRHPNVGLYACGPTVYGPPHLGHARSAITYDIVYRYLTHLGYKVRYVRNITDVGHLENDADVGEDKIAKRARLEELEPMEVVQNYMNKYHLEMDKLNVLRPSIEPRASGHIPEQIKMVEQIVENGYGYVVNGSVYFDVLKYREKYNYGELSGRNIDEQITGEGNRELEGQTDKKNSVDFALWKRAEPQHIMKWDSPWGQGFPGWHLECSLMSTRYLGDPFDIHGGGMDLLFPHHECEIAQSIACTGKPAVRYWMHNNMITLNGQKMGKSLGNAIDLEQFFNGDHPLLDKAYQPMTIRFFMLQAHYRSTLDFSNEALQASEKGLKKLMAAKGLLKQLIPSDKSDSNVKQLIEKCYKVFNDDFNTAELLGNIFEGVRIIHSTHDKKESLTAEDIATLSQFFKEMVEDVLGLKEENQSNDNSLDSVMKLVLELRSTARLAKDYATSDTIRDRLAAANISVEDTKDGARWKIDY